METNSNLPTKSTSKDLMPFLDQEALSQFPKVRQLSSNFNSENWKTIAQTLFQINVMIGSRETITPAEMVKLCEFLVKHYKDFNAKEIEHAFELFATRELPEIDYSKDRIYNKLIGHTLKSDLDDQLSDGND